MENEILLIDKPAGMSSFGVVARVRRVLTERARKMAAETGNVAPKRVKVGHTGTLDPFATGLLILLVGKGTKRSGEFLKLDKRYEATVRLGATSTTGDVEGEITDFFRVSPANQEMLPYGVAFPDLQVIGSEPRKKPFISPSEVEAVAKSFVGEVEQRVPAYSAVKINGQRAYKLAREGKAVEMPVRKVKIYDIEILEYKWPELRISCHVSSGTYIRALGEDIGAKLGVGGYLTALRRTEVGEYKVEDAMTLEEFLGED